MMHTYDAKNCTVTFAGVYITGLAESFINASKDEEFFSTSVGAQGDVVVSETNNDLGTITVTVQASSPQRSMLVESAKNGDTEALWVHDSSTNERVGGTKARIKNYPEIEKAAEGSDLEFEFQVFDYTVE